MSLFFPLPSGEGAGAKNNEHRIAQRARRCLSDDVLVAEAR